MHTKQEIAQIINTPLNEVLSELVQHLPQVEKAHLFLNFTTILVEDKEVLERLAR